MRDSVTKARSRLAVHRRWHPEDVEGLAERKRELRAAMLEKHIVEAVDSVPPFTAEERFKLASLLAG